MFIYNKENNYSRIANVLYENNIAIYRFINGNFPDYNTLNEQSMRYMQKYINMFPQNRIKMAITKGIKRFFYDTETTGTNWRRCSIHQLAAFIEIDGVVVEKIDMKFSPHENALIEDGALEVGKVTLEQIQAYPNWRLQFIELKKILAKYVNPFDKTDKFFFVGFKNASFDDDFMKKLFDLNDTGFWLYFWPSSIDVSVLAAQYLINIRHTMPSFKLHRVAKTLGIPVEDEKLHDAFYDVELTKAVYEVVSKFEENLY